MTKYLRAPFKKYNFRKRETVETVNGFFCFINHQLKLVVNKKIGTLNRFIGFQIFVNLTNIFPLITLLECAHKTNICELIRVYKH